MNRKTIIILTLCSIVGVLATTSASSSFGQEIVEPMWLSKKLDAENGDLERMERILADQEANSVLAGEYFVDCQGWLRNTELKGAARSTEKHFRFVGVVDQRNKRVRWICRSSVKASTGEELTKEYDFIDSGGDYAYWINGVKENRFVGEEERVGKMRGLNREVIRFHPMALALAGMGGLNDYFNRNVVVLQKPDTKYLTRLSKLGSETKAIWHLPSSDNYIRKEATFDAKCGGMPTFARDSMVLVDKGVQFVIQETTTEWTVDEADLWLPAKSHLVSYRGGEKNPKQISELIAHFEWFRKVERTQLDMAFELDVNDWGRPKWTNQLFELLGDSQRVDLSVIGLGNVPPNLKDGEK